MWAQSEVQTLACYALWAPSEVQTLACCAYHLSGPLATILDAMAQVQRTVLLHCTKEGVVQSMFLPSCMPTLTHPAPIAQDQLPLT